jgi:hypothetical protein
MNLIRKIKSFFVKEERYGENFLWDDGVPYQPTPKGREFDKALGLIYNDEDLKDIVISIVRLKCPEEFL